MTDLDALFLSWQVWLVIIRNVKSFENFWFSRSWPLKGGTDEPGVANVGACDYTVVNNGHHRGGTTQAAVDPPTPQHLSLNVQDGLAESLGWAVGKFRVGERSLRDARFAVS